MDLGAAQAIAGKATPHNTAAAAVARNRRRAKAPEMVAIRTSASGDIYSGCAGTGAMSLS
jgi:hypothetical protein